MRSHKLPYVLLRHFQPFLLSCVIAVSNLHFHLKVNYCFSLFFALAKHAWETRQYTICPTSRYLLNVAIPRNSCLQKSNVQTM